LDVTLDKVYNFDGANKEKLLKSKMIDVEINQTENSFTTSKKQSNQRTGACVFK